MLMIGIKAIHFKLRFILQKSLVEKVQKNQMPDMGSLFLEITVRRNNLVVDSLKEVLIFLARASSKCGTSVVSATFKLQSYRLRWLEGSLRTWPPFLRRTL